MIPLASSFYSGALPDELGVLQSSERRAHQARGRTRTLDAAEWARGSERTKSLMNTAPASMREATRSARSGLVLQTGSAEAIFGVVCQGDRLVFVLEGEEHCDRSEKLLTRDRSLAAVIPQ